MAETVECDMLFDACCFNPVFQRLACHAPFQTFEYLAACALAHKVYGFITERQLDGRFGFLDRDDYAQTDCRNRLNVFPLKVFDITDTKSSKTREEGCTTQNIMLARGLCQLYKFLLCQEIAVNFFPFDIIEEIINVFG